MIDRSREFLTKHKVPFLVIILLSFVAWHKIIYQVPLGEGYYYFDTEYNAFLPHLTSKQILSYDFFAQLIFPLLILLFKGNLVLYMLLQLLVFTLLYCVLYLTLFIHTRKKLVSLSSTTLFLANYVGSFTMMASGNYQRFVQRVPNLIPLFVSFIYLNKYLAEGKVRYLAYSFVAFGISVIMAHFSIFLLPLFVFYPIIDLLTTFKRNKIISRLSIPTFFIFFSYIFTPNDPLKPSIGILEFVRTTPDLLEKALLQLPSIFIPHEVVKYLSQQYDPPVTIPYVAVMRLMLVLVIATFLITIAIFPRKHLQLFRLYLSSGLSLIGVSFINLYTYAGTPNPLRNFGEDRIYFVPSILSSIIIAVTIWVIFYKKRHAYYVVLTSLLSLFLLSNISNIWAHTEKIRYYSTEMKNYISFAKSVDIPANERLVLISPSHLSWPFIFVERIYTKDRLINDGGYGGWEERLKKHEYSKITVIDYDYEQSNLDPKLWNQGKVVVVTDKFMAERGYKE